MQFLLSFEESFVCLIAMINKLHRLNGTVCCLKHTYVTKENDFIASCIYCNANLSFSQHLSFIFPIIPTLYVCSNTTFILTLIRNVSKACKYKFVFYNHTKQKIMFQHLDETQHHFNGDAIYWHIERTYENHCICMHSDFSQIGFKSVLLLGFMILRLCFVLSLRLFISTTQIVIIQFSLPF